MRRFVIILAVALQAALSTADADNASSGKAAEIQATKLDPNVTLHLDGRLDEPQWAMAEPISEFHQREPHEGSLATEATEVRILYTKDALIIGVTAHDRDAEGTISRILQRDKIITEGFDGQYEFGGDDVVAILLDPFLDRRNAFVFAANANGAEFDALITDESPTWNMDWRSIWRVASVRTDQGWSVEFEIPFRSLRYPQTNGAEKVWGFNVLRFIRRRSEVSLWTSWMRAGGGFHRVSQAGLIRGLSELPRSGFNLEIKPVALLGTERKADAEPEWIAHPGLDMKWEVQPGLVLDATLNPDFAQVEADDERVNLTRFDLFYPEKRDFFLENAGIFDFGSKGFFEPPPFLLFMSRSIGIKEEEEVPLLGGIRLSGRAGRQTIGFLDVAANAAAGQPRTNHSVFRYKRDIGKSNYLGFALTDRRNNSDWNTAGGIDASFWPTSSVNVQTFIARTETFGPGGDDLAYRAAVEYSGDRFGFDGEHLVIGPDINAEMGFVTRTDIRRTSGNGRITFRPDRFGIRRITLFGLGSYISRLDGEIQDRNFGQFVETEWESGEILALFSFQGFTRLDEEFSMSDVVPVPTGDYSLRDIGFMATSSRKRLLAASMMADEQRCYQGRIRMVETGLTLAPSAHLSMRTDYTYSQVRLPAGAFDSHVGSFRLVWALSTRLSAQTLVQYNSLDKDIIINARLHFIHHPGSDFYIVWNDERGSASSPWTLGRRDAVMKLTYLIRL
ncbi:MAG: hypothetical protein EHM72_06930 [Calditrichaeota bacterium]|nr:MAG: hypothetical protein EHM72_06930 [Calditrichota bacterium]